MPEWESRRLFASRRTGRREFVGKKTAEAHILSMPWAPTRVSRRGRPFLEILTLCLFASYLVDPASSHMLVSKIKPCMSKYKPH
jgi:hypothetical protein